ncbi:MAG: ribosomal protein S18-alanine N-acetyltransferase, partial [Pseudomonadota bacterium]
PWTDGEIEDLMHTRSNWAFVARSADRPERVAGFTVLRTAVDEAEILTIAVKPSWQRHGVGRMLMDSALQRAYTERFASIFLEVGETNRAARALYTKLGFISVGERRNYYQHADGTRGNAIVMRRDFAKR